MRASGIAERGQLGLAEGVAASETVLEAGVVSGHDLPRDAVTDGPQAHHQGFGACQEQSTAESVYAFAVLHFPDPGFARGEGHNPGTPKVERGGFERSQDSVVALALIQIGARQRQAGAQKGVLEFDVRLNRPGSIGREGRGVVEKETVSGDVKNEGRVYALEGCLGGLPACKNGRVG